MTIKAKLRITLTAGETVVAESEDPILWQDVLSSINATKVDAQGAADIPRIEGHAIGGKGSVLESAAKKNLCTQLGVTAEVLDAACAPSKVAPYLHLDLHCWEEMKRQLPASGPGAMSPTAMAATLLCLWFRVSNMEPPTQIQVLGVLSTIEVKDGNASRGVKRSQWLQPRPGGVIVLNPAQISMAISIAKSFCSKQWKSEGKKSAK